MYLRRLRRPSCCRGAPPRSPRNWWRSCGTKRASSECGGRSERPEMDRAEEAEEKVIEKQPAPEELEYRALTMQAIGALLLAFDAIPAVFVGLRDGSLLWLYWTAIEGLIGMALVAA